MGEQYKKFGKLSLKLVIFAFIIRSAISWGNTSELWYAGKLFKLCYTLLSFAGEAIGITAIIMSGFNIWFWKWKWINKLVAKTPVLYKKYSGSIKSCFDEVVRDGELNIIQSFLKIKITFKTDESFSDSILASIEEIHGVKRLVYIYINEPRGELRSKSPLHYGTASLRIYEDSLQGDYYNDRKLSGSMDLKAVRANCKR